jgi:hypothetical protein
MTIKSTPIHRISVEHLDENGAVDLLVRGTALTDLRIGGTANFSVRPPKIGGHQPEDMHLNSNYVDVRLLFSAGRLEGTEPTA